MGQRTWLFVLILAVPLLGFGVAQGVRSHFDSELRSALKERYPEATTAQLANASVELLCAESNPGLKETCDTDSHLALLSRASLWAAGVGLALLLGIRVAGALARNNRLVLLGLFGPGLYVTVVLLIGLVLTHAAIFMAAIYYGESALVGRIHVGVILVVGLGAAAGALGMAKAAFFLVRNAQTRVIGHKLQKTDSPELWAEVHLLASKLGALPPDNVVVGLDPNFFVTEAAVLCLDGKLVGRTLYCSLPLLRILTRSEFDAIVGHELAHYKGDDTKFSLRFYPVYRGTTESLASLQSAGGDGTRALALLPAIAVLSYFLDSFAVAESRMSRDREIIADRLGASLTTPAVMGSALVKIHAFSKVWTGFDEAVADALREGKVFTNASKLFAETVARSANAQSFEGIGSSHTSHPTDSHPDLALRLEALGTAIPAVAGDALNIAPSDGAIALVANAEQREESVSVAYQLIIARQLGIDLKDDGGSIPSSGDGEPSSPSDSVQVAADQHNALAKLDAEFTALRSSGRATPRVTDSYHKQRAAILRGEHSATDS